MTRSLLVLMAITAVYILKILQVCDIMFFGWLFVWIGRSNHFVFGVAMPLLANIVGVLAVILFVFSYQLKTRRGIILFKIASGFLYVVQYFLLGAFEGAMLDTAAFFVSILAYNRGSAFISRRLTLSIVLSEVFIVCAGLSVYESPISLLPIAGALLETVALWLKKEKVIRIVSVFSTPFWLVYNLISMAYGSAIGSVIALVSLSVAIIRYDVLKKEVK